MDIQKYAPTPVLAISTAEMGRLVSRVLLQHFGESTEVYFLFHSDTDVIVMQFYVHMNLSQE